MALDEPKENDEMLNEAGVNFLVEKELLDKIQPVNIDFVDTAMGSGFSITSALSQGNSCGSCSC
jgi:Fe-S cluster assembly iron-binding protein IscA